MEKLAQPMMGKLSPSRLFNWQNNWILKLISVCFAVLLWYFVVGEDKVDTNIYIPVEIVNLPQNLVIANPFKKQLEATVSGPRGLINGLSRQSITRTINLSKASPGSIVIRNEPETIRFPRGINVLRIQPSHLTLVIDELVERELQIKSVITGSPAPGYELEGVNFEPAAIKIIGPKSIIGSKTVLTTSPINLDGFNESLTTQIQLPLKPEILELIGETIVTARIQISEKTTPKIISRVPVQASNSNGDKRTIEIKPDTVSVHTVLPLSSSRGNHPDLVEARVQTDGLPLGVHKLPVEVTAIESVRILEVSPATVTVKITR